MRTCRFALSSLALFALLALTLPACADVATNNPKAAPGGVYKMDPNHASITFKILHLGFSHYTGRFDKMEGVLNYNNEHPEQSSVDATVYTNSIDTNNAELEEKLRTDKWFNVMKYPTATFHSTKIVRTGPTTGKIMGDFTLMGVTHTITLDATLVGAGQNPLFKNPVIGFSATTTIKRSDYGFTNFLPLIGDDVTLQIEAEFDKAN